MKYLIFSILLISFISCEEEKNNRSILSANVDSNSISFVGHAYRYSDIKNGIVFGLNYHIFNLESPVLYIEAYDSTLHESEFIYPLVTAKYSQSDSVGKSLNYNSINGSLKITNENDGVLFGTFSFTLINIYDETDTLQIDNGYFEITLEENDRIWYD